MESNQFVQVLLAAAAADTPILSDTDADSPVETVAGLVTVASTAPPLLQPLEMESNQMAKVLSVAAADSPLDTVAGLVTVASTAPPLLDALCLQALLAFRAVCPTGLSIARAPMITKLVIGAAKSRNAQCFRLLGAVADAGDRRAEAVATAGISARSPGVRLAAVRVLARVGSDPDRPAVSSLLHALSDSDRCVSAAAARVLPKLVEHGDARVIDSAATRLTHKFSWTRQAALTVLAEVAPQGDITLLTLVSRIARDDQDWCVRAAAARALPRLACRGDCVAYGALREALSDPQPEVRCVAAGAVVHLAVRPSDAFIPSTPKKQRPKRKLERAISDAPRLPSPRSRKAALVATASSPAKRALRHRLTSTEPQRT